MLSIDLGQPLVITLLMGVALAGAPAASPESTKSRDERASTWFCISPYVSLHVSLCRQGYTLHAVAKRADYRMSSFIPVHAPLSPPLTLDPRP